MKSFFIKKYQILYSVYYFYSLYFLYHLPAVTYAYGSHQT